MRIGMGRLRDLLFGSIASLALLPALSQEQVPDTIRIGFGYEGIEPFEVDREIEQVNYTLKPHNLYIDAQNLVKIDASEYKGKELSEVVINSFSKKHDMYFVWSHKQFLNQRNDYAAVESNYQDKVTFMDYRIPKNKISNIITYEIQKHLKKAHKKRKRYSKSYILQRINQEKEISLNTNSLARLQEKTNKQNNDTTYLKNFIIPREISYTLILDEVAHSEASTYMNSLQAEYKEKYNITFCEEDVFEYKLKNKFTPRNIRNKFKKKSHSDLYIIFSTHDWKNRGYKISKAGIGDELSKQQFIGLCDPKRGVILIEVNHEEVYFTTAHEIPHGLGAGHDWKANSYMKPLVKNKNLIMPKSGEISILKNKFKEWNPR